MPTQWKPSDLIAVNKAIASGQIEVRFGDRTIRYRSIDELLRARDVIQQALATPKPRWHVLTPGTGF